MEPPLIPGRWAQAIRREWRLRQLKNPAYGFLFDPAPPDEWVSLACATSGHDLARDQILSVCALRVSGQRVLASERLELLLKPTRPVPPEALRSHRLREQELARGLETTEAMPRLLHFIGSRPLLGYYLEFDLALLEQLIRPLIGIGLPQQAIEVSALYHEWQFRQLPPYQQQGDAAIDLRYASMLEQLGLPVREAPDPLDRAVLTALAFIKLRELSAG
jgi:DNA polymerase-3 subunit epsilon